MTTANLILWVHNEIRKTKKQIKNKKQKQTKKKKQRQHQISQKLCSVVFL